MYSIVLATALAAAGGEPGWQGYSDGGQGSLEDIRREVRELRREQSAQRIDELKQSVADLRTELLLQKLSELRREIEEVRAERGGPGGPPMPPAGMGFRPSSDRAVVLVQAPAGATLLVNDREFPLNGPRSAFLTPSLQPGKNYHYNVKVNYTRDGKTVSRSRRVPVRAGQVVRVAYDEMAEGGDLK